MAPPGKAGEWLDIISHSIAWLPTAPNVPRRKSANPFYAVLIVVGVTFALTASLFGVMTVRKLDPRAAEETGILAFMEQHGLTLMIFELVVLALLTFAAIGTDDYWTGRGKTDAKDDGADVG